MVYKKTKPSNLVTIFYYVMDTVYIYLWKRIDKILTHFGDALCKKFFFIARGVQLDNGVHPPGDGQKKYWEMMITKHCLNRW